MSDKEMGLLIPHPLHEWHSFVGCIVFEYVISGAIITLTYRSTELAGDSGRACMQARDYLRTLLVYHFGISLGLSMFLSLGRIKLCKRVNSDFCP